MLYLTVHMPCAEVVLEHTAKVAQSSDMKWCSKIPLLESEAAANVGWKMHGKSVTFYLWTFEKNAKRTPLLLRTPHFVLVSPMEI